MKKTLLLIFLVIGMVSCSNDEIENTPVTEQQKEKKMIITLGDSLTAGYNLDIKDSYPSQLKRILDDNNYYYKVTNAGVSGDTSANLLERISLYDDIDTDIYILSIGGNDGLRRLNLSDMKDNIEAIINHLKNVNSKSNIVLTGMQIPLNLGLKYSSDFKDVFENIADNNDVYFYEFLLNGVAKDTKLNLDDGIHPNADGYTVVANNLFDFLEKNNLLTK